MRLSYGNISKVGDTYRLYYITGMALGAEDIETDTGRSRVCMIETRDGITWTRPSLGIHEWNGSTDNNIVMTSDEHLFDNFLVFWDENPDCPAEERVKATSMMERKDLALSEGRRELWCYTSPDGIHFKKGWKMTDSSEPMGGIFDSSNVAFWDAERGKYMGFVRGLHDGPGRGTAGGLRDIRYMESTDFRTWTNFRVLDFGGSDDYELYTNNISRYYRAPHVFVGFPTRYTERHWLVKNFDYLGGEVNAESRRNFAAIFGAREGFVITDGLFIHLGNHGGESDFGEGVLGYQLGPEVDRKTFSSNFLQQGYCINRVCLVSRNCRKDMGLWQLKAENLQGKLYDARRDLG